EDEVESGRDPRPPAAGLERDYGGCYGRDVFQPRHDGHRSVQQPSRPATRASTAPARNAPTTSAARGTSQTHSAATTRTGEAFCGARYATTAPKQRASRTPKRTDTAGEPGGRYPAAVRSSSSTSR